MKTNLSRFMAVAVLASAGLFAANAKVIIPLGARYQQPWEAKYFYAQQGEDGPSTIWYKRTFDDSSWGTLQGPISSVSSLPYYNTVWPNAYGRYWVRHRFTVENKNTKHAYYLHFSHDDECEVYINNVLVTNQTGALTNQTVQLSEEAVAALRNGDDNVLAMYVNDSGGGVQFLDFGLYEDDGKFQDVVQSDDVQVSFSNDKTYPWWSNGWGEIYNGNRSATYSTSRLKMSFSSTYRTELKFDWYCNSYSDYHDPMRLYIDNKKVAEMRNGSWTTSRYYIEPGDHVVMFRDSIGRSTSYGDSGLRNICLRQLKPLETAVLTSKSKKLTFQNDETYPWTIEDGYIQNGNYGYANTSSSFSTTFTLSKTSKLSYEVAISASSSDTHRLNIYVNGVEWEYWTAQRDFTRDVWTLEPGTYTIEWKDTTTNSNVYYARIRNIEVSNKWVEVELAAAGTLGYEVLYTPGVDVLTDVEFLKVKGKMNASDWTDIKNMTNLLALDLSEADITELPNQVFDGKSPLSSVILPEGLKTIGEYAFRGTDIRNMKIPSTVTTIGRAAFAGTPLTYLTFANNSQINTIGYYAFQSCPRLQSVDFGKNSQLEVIGNYAFQNCPQLKSVNFRNMNNLHAIKYAAFADCGQMEEFIMPNSVTEMGYYMFHNNTSMKKVHLSNALTYVADMAFRNCTALTEVHLPSNAETIYRNAFESTTALRHIDIPETVNTIQLHAFYNCGLDSIVLPIKLTNLGHQCFHSSQNLKYAEMPSFISSDSYSYRDSYGRNDGDGYYTYTASSGWDNTFQNCPAIEKIVMRSATPPAVRNDITNGGLAKNLITLVVPSFAVVSYKLDTYWYQFGSIVEGDDVDYWKITSPLMLTNNRRMQGTPDVDLYFGGQLTVGGSAPFPMNNFNMYVNESNPGRLLNTCEEMTASKANIKFTAEGGRWYFFTVPYNVYLSAITASNDAIYVIRYYDAQNRAANGASGSWKNVDSDKLIAGQGYILNCNKACEITFPATASSAKQKLFNTKDVSTSLTTNESATKANRSWNYVGNPYPCYYDIYYMEFTAPITVWNGSTYQAYSIADDEFVLRPMQSFFVQKPDAVSKIIFPKEGRQLTTAISHGSAAHAPARVARQANRFLFNLTITCDGQSDMTRVVINNEASMGYEIECDASKFMSLSADVPQIYTLDGEGNTYAINERPLESGQVRLAYYAGKAGVYTINAQRADGKVWLYDAEEDRTVDLTEEDYTFQSTATNGFDSSRFTLTFEVDDPTGIIDTPWSSENSLPEAWFSIDGRRLSGKPVQRGLYIGGGRKVTIK